MSTIATEIQRYLDQHSARSQHTARTYRNALSRFTNYLAERGIELDASPNRLTVAVARDFITWLARQLFRRSKASPEEPLSMRSRQLYAQAVSGLYRQLVLEGLLEMTYGEFMALHKTMMKATSYSDTPIEKRLPPDEVVDMVIKAVLTPPVALTSEGLDERNRRRVNLIWLRDKAMILCLHSTGMRVGELVGLRRGDLDYEHHGAWVIGKGDRERFVRFSLQAWQALMTYLDGRHDDWVTSNPASVPLFCRHDRSAGDSRRLPLSTNSVERIITNLAKTAGVLERFHLTPHSFRHFFATRFLRHTRNLALTQDVMGHAGPGTTRIYAKTTKEDHIQAHESLFDYSDEGSSQN
jgi:integrase/recombinase XerC